MFLFSIIICKFAREMQRKSHIIGRMVRAMLTIIVAMLVSSCYNSQSETPDAWDLTDQQLDSISFSTSHHYSQNYNFVVKADSLLLNAEEPSTEVLDSAFVVKGNEVVVADIQTIPADTIDSVWVKIARDQFTQGWIRECNLLTGVAPNDPISQFIDFFTDTHRIIFLYLLMVVGAAYSIRKLLRRNARFVHFNDIDSFYPTLLALLVASSAVFYSSIQLFNPESWRHFYYHPSLNPFLLPTHISIFITSVWALLIVGIATIDDVMKKLDISGALLYLLGLAAVCAVDYVVFSVSTLYYIGYPLLIVYYLFSIRRYMRHSMNRYKCGKCGHALSSKGKCPHCGAMNV